MGDISRKKDLEISRLKEIVNNVENDKNLVIERNNELENEIRNYKKRMTDDHSQLEDIAAQKQFENTKELRIYKNRANELASEVKTLQNRIDTLEERNEDLQK